MKAISVSMFSVVHDPAQVTVANLFAGIILDVVGAVVLFALLYSFWLEFNEWRYGDTESFALERGPHDTAFGN